MPQYVPIFVVVVLWKPIKMRYSFLNGSVKKKHFQWHGNHVYCQKKKKNGIGDNEPWSLSVKLNGQKHDLLEFFSLFFFSLQKGKVLECYQ